jgi:hypothetical protein
MGIKVIGNRVCSRKVFIVLHDVDGEKQLEALAGNHDWFGSGSRIIVTSRDGHLLDKLGVNAIYEVNGYLSVTNCLKKAKLESDCSRGALV